MKLAMVVFNIIGISHAFPACNTSQFVINKKNTRGSSVTGSVIMKCAAVCLSRRDCKYFLPHPKCRLKRSFHGIYPNNIFDVAIFPKKLVGFQVSTTTSRTLGSVQKAPDFPVTWINTTLSGFQTPTMTTSGLTFPQTTPYTRMRVTRRYFKKARQIAREKPKDPCEGYEKVYQNRQMVCYRLHNEVGMPVNWNQANARCKQEGARLAVVKKKIQLSVVTKVLSKASRGLLAIFQQKFNRKIWIGLKGNNWVDGSKVSDKEVPINKCAALDFSRPFTRRYHNCNMNNFFVCEKVLN